VDTVKFFGFDNIQKLNSSGKSVKKEIEKIEKHLSEQVGPNIKSLVTTAFDQENELLDNFSYLIDYEKHKKSHKKVSSFYLLNLLINLSKYAKFCPEKLLTQKNLNKIITLNQDSIIEAINKINDTEPYGGHMRLSDLSMVFDRNTKTSVLFELVGLGCITKEIINKFLAEKVDINAEHNRETLLSLITYQLTKVGRKTDFLPIPRKYTVDPEKQDQLIDIALYLIQKKANINSESHKTGFLPILFSIIPIEQSPYIYKKLLSDKEVISQLNLQEVDPLGRNLAHLFCKDIGEFFHSSTDPEAAKIEICTILTRIIASKNTYHLNNQDRLGNTPWHYLASSITTEYVNIKTDHSFSQLKNQIGLNITNRDGDTPLHTAFNQKADPAAFYKFVLTDIYPPTQWLKCPRLGLKIKNNQKQTVLDMIIHTKNKLAASIINVYMAVVNYKIDLDDDYTFENIHSKVNSFLKSIGKVTIDEIEQTIYLAKSYDSTQYVSSSSSSSSTPSSHLSVRFGGIKSNGEIISLGGSDTSTLASSSLSSSSSSSISHSFSSSFPSHPHLPSGLGIETTERELSDAHDGHTIPALMGESDDFTLHG
jgi:hypothetical protein